jgi:hypothetical protein
MKITQETSVYNDRRYGRPWIAKVDFTESAKGEFTFGDWCGQNGSEGILMIDAHPGDIIAIGQKDTRKPGYGSHDYHYVSESGSLGSVSKAEAFKHWSEHQNNETSEESELSRFATTELIEEIERRKVIAKG